MAFRALYRCNGEGVPLDPGNLDEYAGRTKGSYSTYALIALFQRKALPAPITPAIRRSVY